MERGQARDMEGVGSSSFGHLHTVQVSRGGGGGEGGGPKSYMRWAYK